MLTPGRPIGNRIPLFQFWQDNEVEATLSRHYFFIDKVLSKWCNQFVPLLTDAIDSLKQQLVSDCQRVLAIRDEKRKYADAYNRYVALQRELQEKATRIDELAGMLGTEGLLKAEIEDHTHAITDTLEVHTAIAQLRKELPLWKAVRWYVGYVGEARINDVILFLQALGVEGANRSAIESALRKHPETFSIRVAKREKYLSLKGAG
ncbi:MAG: hypothetical protein RB191_04855 [Terriglobia bacterium]|nr:hypothetical protein [Terriglobia bacterium]